MACPLSSTTLPPKVLMASVALQVSPSYLANWPAKQLMPFFLAIEHIDHISSSVFGGLGTRSLR